MPRLLLSPLLSPAADRSIGHAMGTIFSPHYRQAQWTVAPADRPLPS
jgi:hypothetical protein